MSCTVADLYARMPLYLPSTLNGYPGNAFSELEHQHVLCCTICSMTEKLRIYPIPGAFQQGQSLPLEPTKDNT